MSARVRRRRPDPKLVVTDAQWDAGGVVAELNPRAAACVAVPVVAAYLLPETFATTIYVYINAAQSMIQLFTRLLLLRPGSAEEPFRGSLKVFNVYQSPLYEALSYTWGKEAPNGHIRLDGSQLKIRPTLKAALRHLRLPDQSRWLWIDAICIDQSSASERSQQVQYMREIYSRAARVIVWLGLKAPGVEIALKLVGKVAGIQQTLAKSQQRPEANSFSEAETTKTIEVLRSLPRNAVHSLLELLKRPYFRRCWCIQEIVACSWAVARIEELEIAFSDLLACAGAAYYRIYGTAIAANLCDELSGSNFVETIPHLWASVHERKRGLTPSQPPEAAEISMGPLFDLMIHTQEFQATDPRDRLFALLGITDDGMNLGPEGVSAVDDWKNGVLRPNYTKNAVSVYQDLTRYQLHHSPGYLEVLCYVNHRTDPNSGGYPSWVPKWHEPRECSALDMGIFSTGAVSGRLGASVYNTSVSLNIQRPDTLILNGRVIDRVFQVSDALPTPTDLGTQLQPVLKDLWQQLFNNPMVPRRHSRYHNNEFLDVAFCMAAAAGALGYKMHRDLTSGAEPLPSLDEEELTARAHKDIAAFLISLLKNSDADPSTYIDLRSMAAGGDADRFLRVLTVASYNRRMFLTIDGKLGLGPKIMLPEDEIVILLGGRLPFVLRRKADHHVLVGACYVHDLELTSGKTVDDLRRFLKDPNHPAFYTFMLR